MKAKTISKLRLELKRYRCSKTKGLFGDFFNSDNNYEIVYARDYREAAARFAKRNPYSFSHGKATDFFTTSRQWGVVRVVPDSKPVERLATYFRT